MTTAKPQSERLPNQSYRQAFERLSHDVANLVAAVRFSVAALDQRKGAHDAPSAEAGRIDLALDQILSLLQRKLHLMAADTEAPGDTHSDLHAALRDSMDILHCPILDCSRFVFQPNGNLPRVALPRADLMQVLFNLLKNASDASMLTRKPILVKAGCWEAAPPADWPEVTVGEIIPGQKTVSVTILDQGVGMTPEALERCLTPFYTTKGADGTGLGLPIVADLIAWHGGSMRISSKPGQGTLATLTLPTAASATST